MNTTAPNRSSFSDAEQPLLVLTDPPAGSSSEGLAYRIAGLPVLTDLDSPWLQPFRVAADASALDRAAPLTASFPHSYDTVFAGRAWLGNREVEITCRTAEERYQVLLSSIGDFEVTQGGRSVSCTTQYVDRTSDAMTMALLGAPFLVACALRRRWCLHAGAVALPYGVVAFVGESGLGKSTLASYFAQDDAVDATLASDDILPVSLGVDRAFAHPDYPQFKLPPDKQPQAPHAADPPRLHAVFSLASVEPGREGARAIRVGAAESALILAGNTVAARLFARPLLRRHLAFCAELANTVPVFRLEYQRQFDQLPHVREVVLESASAQA